MLKKLGLGFLVIPVGILLLFTVGEVFSGDISGLGHVIQMLPFLGLGWLGYKKPVIGGWLLLVLGFGLGVWYFLNSPVGLLSSLIVLAILCLPACVSGILLIWSGRRK